MVYFLYDVNNYSTEFNGYYYDSQEKLNEIPKNIDIFTNLKNLKNLESL